MAELPDLTQTEAAIIERTNTFRKAEGLPSLVRNLALEYAAKRFAQYLAKSGRFAHEADGRQPADRTKEAGYWHCTIAENLALNLDSRGFSAAKLADEAIEGWKQSPGHRKNMLLPHVTEIGVGVARAPGSEPKFLSVQLFGRPQSLAYQFKIANKSTQGVTYSFGGQTHRVEPLETVTHKACDPGRIEFTSAGGWLGGTRLDQRYEARDQAELAIRNTPGGKLEIVEKR